MYIDDLKSTFMGMGSYFLGGKIGEILSASLVFWQILLGPAFAQAPKQTILNEYGLKVISTKIAYFEDIKLFPNKKMVAVTGFVHPLQTSWSYATTNNFTHQILYKKPVAYVRLPAALALEKVADTLKKLGFGIRLFDAYRPYSVTKKMWEIVPDDNYAANPATGSGHNRGIAVDLTLVDITTGKELEMPTAFDNFSDTAHHDFMKLSNKILINRRLLKSTMEKYGFMALPTEWWHYSLPNPKDYEILDIDFKDMKKLMK